MGAAYTYPWDDLRFSFFSPLSHLRVDLVAEFRLYFTRVASEEGKEPLCPAIDDIYLVKRDRVDDLLALLDLAFRTLHEFGLLEMNALNT